MESITKQITKTIGPFRVEYSVAIYPGTKDKYKPELDMTIVKDPDTLALSEWQMGASNPTKSPVTFYKGDDLLFTHQPEYYYQNNPNVIFYQFPSEKYPGLSEEERTIFTICLKFNELAVYNMKNELIQNTFNGREFMSNLVDLGDWIIMFSWIWGPHGFLGIIQKKPFFEDIFKTKNQDIKAPQLGVSVSAETLTEVCGTGDVNEMMETQQFQNIQDVAWSQIKKSMDQDPGERNRAGLCIPYEIPFYYDKTGFYWNNKHYSYSDMFSRKSEPNFCNDSDSESETESG